MKKILIVIILVIMLSGCTAEINVDITDKKAAQEILITVPTSDLEQVSVLKLIEKKLFETEFSSEVLQYYRLKRETTTAIDRTGRYTIEYALKNEMYDYLLNRCYENYSLKYENDKLILSTSSKFLCYDEYKFDGDINLNINTDYKVVSNNADKKETTKYTWNITKENADNKPINLEIDFSNKSIYAGNTIIIIIICAIIGVIALWLLSLYGKKQKNNEI